MKSELKEEILEQIRQIEVSLNWMQFTITKPMLPFRDVQNSILQSKLLIHYDLNKLKELVENIT